MSNDIDVRKLAQWYLDGWDMQTLEQFAIDSIICGMKEDPSFYNEILKQYKEHNDETDNG